MIQAINSAMCIGIYHIACTYACCKQALSLSLTHSLAREIELCSTTEQMPALVNTFNSVALARRRSLCTDWRLEFMHLLWVRVFLKKEPFYFYVGERIIVS
jgi:hypothetical protein